MKRALITGITGQDGSYLAELLLQKGYEVHGTHRRSNKNSFETLSHIKDKINFHYVNLLDAESVDTAVKTVMPDEIYNLAAMSQVGVSFKQPYLTYEVNYYGLARIIKTVQKYCPKARFYQASTSEMYGNQSENPKDENTPFAPVSPYGESKRDAHVELIRNLAQKMYGMFAVGGILFNHDSPRRSVEFVTRKISHAVARIKAEMDNKLCLGNLKACRDWGFAGDYVKAMWLMLQNDEPEDFVVATGKTHSVKTFLDHAFNYVGLDYEIVDLSDRKEKKADELIRKEFGKGGPYVIVHPRFFRPVDISVTKGNSSQIRKKLGWKPEKTFQDLVEMMIKSDLNLLQKKNQTLGV